MGAVTIQQMADRVATLMEQRLHVKGAGLAEKLRRGGRMLPRKVRAAADALAEAAHMSQNPKLLLRVNEQSVAEAYDACVQYLGGMNRWERRMTALMTFGATFAFILLVVAALVAAVLYWRGLV